MKRLINSSLLFLTVPRALYCLLHSQ